MEYNTAEYNPLSADTCSLWSETVVYDRDLSVGYTGGAEAGAAPPLSPLRGQLPSRGAFYWVLCRSQSLPLRGGAAAGGGEVFCIA